MIPNVKLLAYTQLAPFFAEELGTTDPLALVEYAGRWDYGPKSIGKMGDRSIIRRWIDAGEESMVEMVDVAFLITCSRVVSHELVRHRIASFQQESQRYVSYENDSPDDLFTIPEANTDQYPTFALALNDSLLYYKKLLEKGMKKQIARYVLPNATRTRVIAKMNLREWRHVLALRLHKSAQPEMREVMVMIRDHLMELFPMVFEDVTGEDRATR